jgi:anti-sigma B factor antagonist
MKIQEPLIASSSDAPPQTQVVISSELVRPSQSEELRAHLKEVLDQAPSALILDLSRVDYLGSSAIAILLTFIRRARECGGTTEILVGSKDVLRTLQLTRIDHLIPVREISDF